MSNEIKFSIIIPTYNSAPFIEEALKSVCDQSYSHFEVIISDDYSADNTVKLVTQFFQNHPLVDYQIIEADRNEGAGAARNKGILSARYEWIAFLDSDDYWVRHKLAHVVQAIKTTDTNYVFHNEIYLENNTEHEVDYISRYDTSVSPFIALVRKNFLSPSSATIHKSLFERAGLFDISLRSAEDYDLWLKMSLSGLKLCPLQEYLAYYRVRDGNLTSNVQQMLDCLLQVVARYKQKLNDLSANPSKESRCWQGRIYSSCGLMFLRKKQYITGTFYIIYGQFFSPRVDWIKKLIRN